MASPDVEFRCFVAASLGPPPTALSRRLSVPMAILESKIINDREIGRSRGFGFVTFRDEKPRIDAIEGMNGQNLDGRNIIVNEAQSHGSETAEAVAVYTEASAVEVATEVV
ncbi:hypothetical protein LWI28_005022 [Acer negundo]|uniref:RRM domain-containing protein n=1 Tax=Acer negundo TaxID=4023 RepID=A0AAD5NUU5_ACENE|nr:hypothetical protein LWI28_005022 [Acer negundo]KAK4852712.1 hypothetical protein QYF36_026415 [Acer negundo]